MTYRSSCGRSVSYVSSSYLANKTPNQIAVLLILMVTAFACIAQGQTQIPSPTDAQANAQSDARDSSTVTLPAGTRIVLVLTHDLQSRAIHRGDDIYAQVTAPVNSGDAVVIPPGTFVQGTVDKVQRRRGRAELHLQSMTISFPDGYVVPISGPLTLESDEGYMLKDPGSGRLIGMFAMPAGGAGLGALIGHSVASSQPTNLTNSLPPGCTGVPPACLTSSLSVPASKGKATVIGAAVGGAVGMVGSLVLFSSSRHFFLGVGTPVDLVLPQSVSLKPPQVDQAVRDSEEHPAPQQAIAARPTPPPPSNHEDCCRPGSPGTPATVLPDAPSPNGITGPPITIPGTPPTLGTAYPSP